MFPDMTGPRPLLLPATATNTVGTASPEEGATGLTPGDDLILHRGICCLYRLNHTFIFCFDAQCLVGAFVCRGDSQDAGDAVGGAGLLDLFTVGHV